MFIEKSEFILHKEYVAKALGSLVDLIRRIILKGYSEGTLKVDCVTLNGCNISNLVVTRHNFSSDEMESNHLIKGFNLRFAGELVYGRVMRRKLSFDFHFILGANSAYDGDFCRKLTITCLAQGLDHMLTELEFEFAFKEYFMNVASTTTFSDKRGLWIEAWYTDFDEFQRKVIMS